jgi:hypothetical protein
MSMPKTRLSKRAQLAPNAKLRAAVVPVPAQTTTKVGPGDGGLRFEAERGQAGSGVTAQIVRTGLETGLHPPQALRHRRGRTDHTVAVVLSNLVSEKRRNSSVKGRCSQRHLARRSQRLD